MGQVVLGPAFPKSGGDTVTTARLISCSALALGQCWEKARKLSRDLNCNKALRGDFLLGAAWLISSHR